MTVVPQRSEDAHIFLNDLLNAAHVAASYGSQGVLAFNAGPLLAREATASFSSYRSILQSDWALSSGKKHNHEVAGGVARLPGGMYAQEAAANLNKENFNDAFLAAISPAVKQDRDESLSTDFDEGQIRSWIRDDLRGMEVLTKALSQLGFAAEAKPAPLHEQQQEDEYPGLFQKENMADGATKYTWPDKTVIMKTKAGIFLEGETSPKTLRRA